MGFELIQRFYETVNDAIYSRGGIVNKFLGDGALAVFEVKNPEDAEILAQAAIDAAIQIQSKSLLSSAGKLQVCAGIHLGQVVFATVGKAPKLEFTVLGDAVNQQGMQQLYEDFCSRDSSDCAGCPFPEMVHRE
jgi:adenylate cyclase